MKKLTITKTVTVVCEPGSVVIVSDRQAAAVRGCSEEVKEKTAPKKAAAKK